MIDNASMLAGVAKAIKEADLISLATERRDLLTRLPGGWPGLGVAPLLRLGDRARDIAQPRLHAGGCGRGLLQHRVIAGHHDPPGRRRSSAW